jgi:DNA polymerase-3 subunit gamma/tau
MTVRTLEAKEVVRAYSPLERFMLMSKKNPKLMKLREVFGLELS